MDKPSKAITEDWQKRFEIRKREIEKERAIESEKKKNREFESYGWGGVFVLIGLILFGIQGVNPFASEKPINFLLIEHYLIFTTLGAVVIIPYIFYLTYSKLPFEILRENIAKKESTKTQIDAIDYDEVDEWFSHKKYSVFFNNISESKEMSQKIYIRSGIYLIIGSMFSIVGIIPVFLISINPEVYGLKLEMFLPNFLPRFTVLFFLETIAFFFLKQYKVMMEEYRYYERIKRTRQDAYSLLLLMEINKTNPESIKIIKDILSNGYNHDSLQEGSLSKIIETDKKEEVLGEILKKIPDSIKLNQK